MSVWTIEEFVNLVEKELDDLEPGLLKADTDFRSLDDWTSMHALIIIVLVDENYSVSINGDDLRASKTLNDLFQIISSRRKE